MNKRIITFVLMVFSILSTYAQSEPDLSHVKTIKDADNCYWQCKSVMYKDKVTQEELRDAVFKLYYLGRRFGMYNMEFGQKYQSYACRIEVKNQEEVDKAESLMNRISYTYTCLQKLLTPMGEDVKFVYWMNFDSDFFVHSHVTNIMTGDNVACFEYNMCGIDFAVFHNFDKNFAYDVTIYHKEKKYNKKTKKYYYGTYERNITVMPTNVYFISSSISIEQFYFKPTSFKITNKYYVGNK